VKLPLSSLILTIDTREKDLKRINNITTFFEKHNAIVDRSKLDLCDYHIEGSFRDIEINLGIEAKTLVDFSSTYTDLPHKLLKSFELYDHVGLFVQTGNYAFNIGEDGLLCTIRNPAVIDGYADILTLPSLENSLGSWANEGIIVRQLLHEAQWPYTMYNVLISLSKEAHHGLELKSTDDYSVTLNMLVKVPGIGVESAKKLIKEFGNLYWMNLACWEDLEFTIGKNKANILYNFFRSKELIDKASTIRGLPK
jgi:hypothetical protein